ncbi:hypothetical protein [Acinetobacter sp. MD2]|uniref:hypothetical protein n=1 Tax=Acinetobacter sp. MD2 TaxID=2600066 RepID=UPI002D1E9FD2|nr:hypothetical protein [Acinetobacter sp. MD2]MEB3767027.1 hypothetical protein [Acinetobacter sp. MD2]
MKKMTLLMVLGSLVGCTAAPTWQKSGVSSYSAQNKLAKCEYDVGMNKVKPEYEQRLIRACMHAQGFRLSS